MARNIRIIVADDHPVVRRGLAATIESEPDYKVIAEVGDGLAALRSIEAEHPDIAVVDISMPEMDGLGVAEEIRRRGLAVKLILLTVHRETAYFEKATEAGAMGYVLKDSAMVEILTCIKTVSAGKCYASPAMAGQMMERRRRAFDLQRSAPALKDLTPTERQVLLMIADYKTSSEIAAALHISPRTVDTHRNNICSKLDLRGRHALMKFAVANRAELG
jgi:DNA-binding NarL/FixJ family response regulator